MSFSAYAIKSLRLYAERDPIVMFSCFIGGFGARTSRCTCSARQSAPPCMTAARAAPKATDSTSLGCTETCCFSPPILTQQLLLCCVLVGLLAPFVIGDGGRKAEDSATNYAYRIKHVYPPKE